MKKQYNCKEVTWCKHLLCVYHNGELILAKVVGLDKLNEETDKLEAEGYAYGYTKEEVEKAKMNYLYRLENIIES